MNRSFADIRRAVPSIHVFKSASKRCDAAVTIITPQAGDERYERRRYSENYTEGNGNRENPYTYRSAASVSPHYAIVDLWFGFRELTTQANARAVFIKVNDWILQVGPEGVTAEDGHFTKIP